MHTFEKDLNDYFLKTAKYEYKYFKKKKSNFTLKR